MAKQSEIGSSQIQRRMEELDKLRSERRTCTVMEDLLKKRSDEQKKDVKDWAARVRSS